MTLIAFRPSWLGEVTTFLAAWNDLAVLMLFGPLGEDLGVSGAKLVWIAVAFDVAAATALRGGASWSRRAGSRVVLAVGAAAFAAASAGCALASGWGALVALRAMQGAAAAVALAAAFDHLTGVSPLTAATDARDIRNAGLGAALAGGPLLACAVAVHDWRLVFWSDAVVGAVVCAAVLAHRGEWRRERAAGAQREPFDVAALVLVGAGVAGPVGALAEAGTAGWGGVPALTLLAFGLMALVPVLAWETPLGGGHRRAFAAAQVADLCLFVSVSGVLLLLAGSFHTVGGIGPLGVGISVLIWSASVAVWLPVAAAIDVLTMRAALAAGLLLHTVALLAMALVVGARGSGLWLTVPLSLSGLGVALALPAARHTAVTVAGMRRSTGVTSGIGAVRLAGSALGTALFATASATGDSGGLGTPFGRAMVPAVTAGAVAATGAVAALALPRQGRRPEQHIA